MKKYFFLILILPFTGQAQTTVWQSLGGNATSTPKVGLKSKWLLDADGGVLSKGRPVLTDIDLAALINANVYEYDGNDSSHQFFSSLANLKVVTIAFGSQTYTSDFFTKSGGLISWINQRMAFHGTLLITVERNNEFDFVHAKEYTGCNCATQSFVELANTTLLSISMGGQEYTADYFIQDGESVSWSVSGMAFKGKIVNKYKRI